MRIHSSGGCLRPSVTGSTNLVWMCTGSRRRGRFALITPGLPITAPGARTGFGLGRVLILAASGRRESKCETAVGTRCTRSARYLRPIDYPDPSACSLARLELRHRLQWLRRLAYGSDLRNREVSRATAPIQTPVTPCATGYWRSGCPEKHCL